MNEYELEIFSTENGKEPFSDWIESLKDRKTKNTLLLRLQRLRTGNFGDFKYFDGLYELRINFGSGYRIYCAKIGNQVILLLGGGDKSSQSSDIKKCKEYLAEKKGRKR